MEPIHIDSRGVEYSETITKNSNRRRGEWGTAKALEKGHCTYSITLRRTSPRPVDIKRSERAARRDAKKGVMQ